MIDKIYNKIINNIDITHNEAYLLEKAPLDKLINYADKIRDKYCSNVFDICSIINAKSGKCSQDCKFCAQSSHYNTDIKEYPLKDINEIVENGLFMAKKGVKRFSIVTSGKSLNNNQIDTICKAVKTIKEQSDILVCVSLGLLSKESFAKLKESGVDRIHNNIETSKNYFSNICSTHTFEDKVSALKIAKENGFSLCSGIIIGLGESIVDRIDAAFFLKELHVDSVPINILNSIRGTPFENNEKLSEEEILRTCAIFRFILPNIFLRLAGGRILLSDYGRKAFMSGINAVITGDMLTTSGINVDNDLEIIKNSGYIL